MTQRHLLRQSLHQLSVWLPALLMVLFALGTWWLVRNTPKLPDASAERPVSSAPDYFMRDFSVRVKLNPVRALLTGKRVIIVEDFIVIPLIGDALCIQDDCHGYRIKDVLQHFNTWAIVLVLLAEAAEAIDQNQDPRLGWAICQAAVLAEGGRPSRREPRGSVAQTALAPPLSRTQDSPCRSRPRSRAPPSR